jgi:hypothetical protein
MTVSLDGGATGLNEPVNVAGEGSFAVTPSTPQKVGPLGWAIRGRLGSKHCAPFKGKADHTGGSRARLRVPWNTEV